MRRQVGYLESRKNSEHNYIEDFIPDVEVYSQIHQDFLCQNDVFSAGAGYEQFDEFILQDALEYAIEGNGVTYVVWNAVGEKELIKKDIVAFFTLSVTAIPYEDRVRVDEDDAIETGVLYDTQICGIPALKIDMFAVNEKYQDLFYEFEGEYLPISAWVMRSIVDYAVDLSNTVLGFKAIFLHALPSAEEFYSTNGFHQIEENMRPFHCIDSELQAMYLALKPVHMNCE